MQYLSIDIETYSSVNLQKAGVYKYAESPDFDILLFGYSVDGGAVHVIDLACGEKIPAEIVDLASASDMVTDAMSALGMEVSEAGTMVDQMAKTASSTNTSVAQLGEGILTIGATAKSVKGGTAELNTALGILANNGIKGAEGGTHLRNIMLKHTP